MILKAEKIGLSLEIEYQLLNNMTENGKIYYPNEFGGFLFGYYTNNNKHLIITDSVLPLKFKSSRYNFERSTEGIEDQLYKFHRESPPKFYIGEWHTHPDSNAIASYADILAMRSIISTPNSCIKNPVLLIIGDSKSKVKFSFYVLYNYNLYKYE